jgi:hypothetical protein
MSYSELFTAGHNLPPAEGTLEEAVRDVHEQARCSGVAARFYADHGNQATRIGFKKQLAGPDGELLVIKQGISSGSRFDIQVFAPDLPDHEYQIRINGTSSFVALPQREPTYMSPDARKLLDAIANDHPSTLWLHSPDVSPNLMDAFFGGDFKLPHAGAKALAEHFTTVVAREEAYVAAVAEARENAGPIPTVHQANALGTLIMQSRQYGGEAAERLHWSGQ